MEPPVPLVRAASDGREVQGLRTSKPSSACVPGADEPKESSAPLCCSCARGTHGSSCGAGCGGEMCASWSNPRDCKELCARGTTQVTGPGRRPSSLRGGQPRPARLALNETTRPADNRCGAACRHASAVGRDLTS